MSVTIPVVVGCLAAIGVLVAAIVYLYKKRKSRSRLSRERGPGDEELHLANPSEDTSTKEKYEYIDPYNPPTSPGHGGPPSDQLPRIETTSTANLYPHETADFSFDSQPLHASPESDRGFLLEAHLVDEGGADQGGRQFLTRVHEKHNPSSKGRAMFHSGRVRFMKWAGI